MKLEIHVPENETGFLGILLKELKFITTDNYTKIKFATSPPKVKRKLSK